MRHNGAASVTDVEYLRAPTGPECYPRKRQIKVPIAEEPRIWVARLIATYATDVSTIYSW
jgi:hypothetical protein